MQPPLHLLLEVQFSANFERSEILSKTLNGRGAIHSAFSLILTFPCDLLQPITLDIILVQFQHKKANKNTNQKGFSNSVWPKVDLAQDFFLAPEIGKSGLTLF